MVIATDTSFLFSLYGQDVNSERAIEWLRDCRSPISLTTLNVFEFENALRFATFKKFYPPVETENYQAAFEAALTGGRLLIVRINTDEIIQTARRLSARHTQLGGHRSFDLLHVAAASTFAAETFLSFDKNQTQLATKIGMATPLMG